MVLEYQNRLNIKDISLGKEKVSTPFNPEVDVPERVWDKILQGLDKDAALSGEPTSSDAIFNISMLDLALLKISNPNIARKTQFQNLAERNRNKLASSWSDIRDNISAGSIIDAANLAFANNVLYEQAQITEGDKERMRGLIRSDWGWRNAKTKAIFKALSPEVAMGVEFREYKIKEIDDELKHYKDRDDKYGDAYYPYYLAWIRLADFKPPSDLKPNKNTWNVWKNKRIDYLFNRQPSLLNDQIFGMAVLSATEIHFVKGRIELGWGSNDLTRTNLLPERRKF